MQKIKSRLIVILEQSLGIMLMVMVGVTFAQVFCRYTLGFSLTWSHELVILVLIWTVWLSIPIGLDRAGHLSVTFFFDQDSKVGKFRLIWLHSILAVLFFGLVFFLSFPVVEAFEGMDLLSIPVPINARYYAAMVGSLLAVFVLSVNLLQLFKED
jgi:TRAP-type C4-dicarboxylate transport system permease small subunit